MAEGEGSTSTVDIETEAGRMADAAGFLAHYVRMRALDLNRSYKYKVFSRIGAERDRYQPTSAEWRALNKLWRDLGAAG